MGVEVGEGGYGEQTVQKIYVGEVVVSKIYIGSVLAYAAT